MAFREVTMLEVEEILRLWLLGVPTKGIAGQLGFDVKTVRRYLAAAKAQGVEQAHGVGALDDELVAAVISKTQPGTGRPRGEGWAVCETHREFIERHLSSRVRFTKVGKLLRRRGVEIEYPTLRRFGLEQFGFGRGPPSVPVVECEPGKEVQVETGWMTLLAPDLFSSRIGSVVSSHTTGSFRARRSRRPFGRGRSRSPDWHHQPPSDGGRSGRGPLSGRFRVATTGALEHVWAANVVGFRTERR